MLSTLSTSISNLVSLLLNALSFSSLLPALVFVVLNESVVLSLIAKYKSINLLDELGTTYLVFWTLLLTILIGYTLRVLNFSIITLFEGYPFRTTRLGRIMTCLQKKRMHGLKKQFEKMEGFIGEELKVSTREQIGDLPKEVIAEKLYNWIEGSDLAKYVERELATCGLKLEIDFPSHESSLAPTALGNTIAAFEEYPQSRYGIDAVFLWPRLVPILSKEKYAIFVEKEKAGFDFLLNLALLTGIFAFECTFLKLAGIELTVLIPATALLSAYLLYRAAIQNASNWGETIKVAFDSYRYQLARQLSIKPFYSQIEEFARWQAFSAMITTGERFKKFDYPLPKETQHKSEK